MKTKLYDILVTDAEGAVIQHLSTNSEKYAYSALSVCGSHYYNHGVEIDKATLFESFREAQKDRYTGTGV